MNRIVIALLLLTACHRESAFEKAQSDLAFLQKSGVATPEELCAAKTHVAEAARAEQLKDEYPMLALEARVYCRSLELQN